MDDVPFTRRTGPAMLRPPHQPIYHIYHIYHSYHSYHAYHICQTLSTQL